MKGAWDGFCKKPHQLSVAPLALGWLQMNSVGLIALTGPPVFCLLANMLESIHYQSPSRAPLQPGKLKLTANSDD